LNKIPGYVLICFIWPIFEKKMSTLGFLNDFIVEKIKQKVTQPLLTKGGVVWWQRHWDDSMRS
jgi:hypothetical protein